ncbi:MAG: hypothetical protein JW720_07910 [Sedimentisphaerales bacterium]|nr:hypothetical protein [Sedimentisphaerales bacterium]
MGKRSVGLQKGLSAILKGAQVPDEVGKDGSIVEKTTRPASYVRLDPIALFEEVAHKRRRQLSVWSRLREVFRGRAAQ